MILGVNFEAVHDMLLPWGVAIDVKMQADVRMDVYMRTSVYIYIDMYAYIK